MGARYFVTLRDGVEQEVTESEYEMLSSLMPSKGEWQHDIGRDSFALQMRCYGDRREWTVLSGRIKAAVVVPAEVIDAFSGMAQGWHSTCMGYECDVASPPRPVRLHSGLRWRDCNAETCTEHRRILSTLEAQ